MIIEKCPNCGSKVEYYSEPHLCPDTTPLEVGIEGNCSGCNTMVYSKFKYFEIEVTEFDENMNEKNKYKIKDN